MLEKLKQYVSRTNSIKLEKVENLTNKVRSRSVPCMAFENTMERTTNQTTQNMDEDITSETSDASQVEKLNDLQEVRTKRKRKRPGATSPTQQALKQKMDTMHKQK